MDTKQTVSQAVREDGTFNVLILEDQELDAEIMVHALRKSGIAPKFRRVDNRDDYLAALEELPDVILADFQLPQFDALRALSLLKERKLDIPFIVVTGNVGETTAVQCLQAGADDYLVKDRLGRLGSAVTNAMREKKLRQWKGTAEKAAEHSAQQWQSTFDAIAAPVFLLDQDGRIVKCNQAAEISSGKPFAQMAGGAPCLHLSCPLAGRDECPVGLMWASNRRETADLRIGDRWFTASAEPVFSDDGIVTGAVHIITDITERKHLEAQLNQSQKLESLGRLAGGIAHDFNNLLTAIMANAELLMMKGGKDARELEKLRIILETSERASHLTHQLLAFSSNQEMEPVCLDVNQIIKEMKKMIPSLVGEDIECRFELNPEAVSVKADPSMIEQIIMNLVVNARDAMPGGGMLSVTTSEVSLDTSFARFHSGIPPGRYLMITTADTGVGMPPEVKDRIFEPFFTTKGDKGTGLGLATVYGHVRKLGGHISCYSEVGHGTEFKIYLPVCHEIQEQPFSEAPVVSEMPRGTETILLVEDEEALKVSVAQVLTSLGYRVLVASDPDEARFRIEEAGNHIDLLLTDVIMPRKRGDVFAAEMKSTMPFLKVVLMSGYTSDRLVWDGLEAEAGNFLNKPFDAVTLATKIRDCLNG